MIQHIIRHPQGYEGLCHLNACGRHVSWVKDGEGTRFSSIHAATESAHAHGLKDGQFHVEPAPDREEVGA